MRMIVAAAAALFLSDVNDTAALQGAKTGRDGGSSQEGDGVSADHEKLQDLALEANRKAASLFSEGKYALALLESQRCVELLEKAFPISRFPDGHPSLANCLSNYGAMLSAAGETAKAFAAMQRSQAMTRRLLTKGILKDESKLAVLTLNLAEVASQMQQPEKGLEYAREAAAMFERIYPAAKHPDGHSNLALGYTGLGSAFVETGDYPKALFEYQRASAMFRKLYPPERFPNGEPNLAACLTAMAAAYEGLGDLDRCTAVYSEALAMHRKLYPRDRFPDGHPMMTENLTRLGRILQLRGEYAAASALFSEAHEMNLKLFSTDKFPNGHSQLVDSTNNLAYIHMLRDEYARAAALFDDAIAMAGRVFPRTVYPNGDFSTAAILSNQGALAFAMGDNVRSAEYHRRALEMRRALFSKDRFVDGHESIAESLNNLGTVLRVLGRPAQARPILEECVAMRRKLQPDRQETAVALHNLGHVFADLGDRQRALKLMVAGVEMSSRAFPGGHPLVVDELVALAGIDLELGETVEAERAVERAIAIERKLHPKRRSPELARALSRRAAIQTSRGRYEAAMSDFREAFDVAAAHLRTELPSLSEMQAVGLLNSMPADRDGFLSAAVRLPNSAASSYQVVWDSKGALMRIEQHRRRAARMRVAASPALRDYWNRWCDGRRRLSRIMNESGPSDAERDKRTEAVDAELVRLERLLAAELPDLASSDEVASGPEALEQVLPMNAAFVDFIEYQHQDGVRDRRRRYLAFVIAPNQPIVRVELGVADPIDSAIDGWRSAIVAGVETRHAADVRKLVWDPVASRLPANIRKVYLCPDGRLSRIPFAAIPSSRADRMLIENLEFAVVPHGPWLLEQLRLPAKMEADAKILAVGDIDYGSPERRFRRLPGTGLEIRQLQEAAKGRSVVALSGPQATVANVLAAFPGAESIHIATHGYFDGDGLEADRIRTANLVRNWAADFNAERPGAILRSPLGYVGLVFAGANHQAKDGDRGFMNGLDLGGQSLDQTRLTVLSACETGLGELAGGEGVQGLQRAFHLAGCPNVVASLWKVPDVPTLVLMEEFYARLWRKEHSLPPIEALREAQLAVMRNPKMVLDRLAAVRADLATRGVSEAELETRGFGRNLAKLPGQGAIEVPSRSPTQWWAGFVLSGVGR